MSVSAGRSRIRACAYAVLPPLDLDSNDQCLRELQHVQAIVAYCYSAPRQTFGDIFFHFEQASLAVFSPEPVSIFRVRPEHGVEPVDKKSQLVPDEWHRVPGYQGTYNFHHPFWLAKGSRLYPPVPHIGLNISQDLAWDLTKMFCGAFTTPFAAGIASAANDRDCGTNSDSDHLVQSRERTLE